ncbi:MAG: DNA polymerase III subunit chi, partial [Pseudomonadota bacterium]
MSQAQSQSAESVSKTEVQKDVLFYILNSTDPQSREVFLNKLLKKICTQKRRCDIRFESEQDALRYDLALWSAQPQSFIPHSVGKQVPASIQLYGEQIVKPSGDVLINLHPQFPSMFVHYQRTIEILDQSDYLIKMGRER